MKSFLKYFLSHKAAVIAYLCFCLVFSVTFFLYELPLDAVLYPALLSAILGIVFITVGAIKENGKHKTLEKLKQLSTAMIDELPNPDSVLENDYEEIILKLKSEHMTALMNAEEKYGDMMEYYTVWAHQIKTPIASMRLALQSEDSDLARRLFSDLSRIEQYADMVLAFLRLDSKSSDYVFCKISIDDVVKQAIKQFKTEFIARGIKLSFSETGLYVISDEKWLLFVVKQLLSNALKYTKSGTISIYLEGNRRLVISDTGIGIAPEDLPRIFEMGYTGYNGRSDKRASGIGLYLCNRVCEKLGIEISADSKLDCGTKISLSFCDEQIKSSAR